MYKLTQFNIVHLTNKSKTRQTQLLLYPIYMRRVVMCCVELNISTQYIYTHPNTPHLISFHFIFIFILILTLLYIFLIGAFFLVFKVRDFKLTYLQSPCLHSNVTYTTRLLLRMCDNDDYANIDDDGLQMVLVCVCIFVFGIYKR